MKVKKYTKKAAKFTEQDYGQVKLVAEKGFSLKQIAEILGWSLPTVSAAVRSATYDEYRKNTNPNLREPKTATNGQTELPKPSVTSDEVLMQLSRIADALENLAGGQLKI